MRLLQSSQQHSSHWSLWRNSNKQPWGSVRGKREEKEMGPGAGWSERRAAWTGSRKQTKSLLPFVHTPPLASLEMLGDSPVLCFLIYQLGIIVPAPQAHSVIGTTNCVVECHHALKTWKCPTWVGNSYFIYWIYLSIHHNLWVCIYAHTCVCFYVYSYFIYDRIDVYLYFHSMGRSIKWTWTMQNLESYAIIS